MSNNSEEIEILNHVLNYEPKYYGSFNNSS